VKVGVGNGEKLGLAATGVTHRYVDLTPNLHPRDVVVRVTVATRASVTTVSTAAATNLRSLSDAISLLAAACTLPICH
jgi:hypothetical protein